MERQARPAAPTWAIIKSILRPPLAEPYRSDQETESYQKSLVARYVFPVMTGMTLLYYAAYWEPTPQKLGILGFGILVTLANLFLSSKNRVLRWGDVEIHSRSDLVDCIRWVFNLVVFDVMLAIFFEPSTVGFVMAWLILVISAQADTFKRRHRAIVVGVGLTAGAVVLVKFHPELSFLEYALVMFCMTGVVFVLGVAESYWLRETHARTEAQKRESDALRQADLLKQDALTGQHLRTVSHEMNNLLGILDMASDMPCPKFGDAELAMIRRAVTYAKKINALVLGDVRSTNSSRIYALSELLQDLQLLLSKEVRSRGIEWELVASPDVDGGSFKERAGSTYFILHNLVKNAWEALSPRDCGDAKLIRVEASLQGDAIVLSIEDNAGGIAPETKAAILDGRACTSKQEGHGLGLRFVLDECRKNGFQLEIETRVGVGSTFRVWIPRLT